MSTVERHPEVRFYPVNPSELTWDALERLQARDREILYERQELVPVLERFRGLLAERSGGDSTAVAGDYLTETESAQVEQTVGRLDELADGHRAIIAYLQPVVAALAAEQTETGS